MVMDSTHTQKSHRNSGRVFLELFLLWMVVLLAIRMTVFVQQFFSLSELLLGIVPVLFMYAPVWLCSLRGVSSWDYHLSVPAFRDGQAWFTALKIAAVVSVMTWVLFIPIYHYYMTIVWEKSWVGVLPEQLLLTVMYHLFYVAIPEEFFYRGYFQTRLNEVFSKDWNVFGVSMGWGSIWANVFFAFGHSVVQFQWWHFSIFLPGMLFSWMREKTNGVLAGAFLHAGFNIGIVVLDTLYGVRSPV